MFVKICGLKDEAAVAAAVEAGANAIGFVFAESVREIEPDAARALCQNVPADVVRVAVMHHPGSERFRRVVDEFAPDWIQTDIEDFAALSVPDSAEALPVCRDGDSLDTAALPPRILFEGRVSGSGTTADWTEARRLAGFTELVLAGGLNADNVGAAIETVRPFGVDVSSGVEYERGRKDPQKIRDFVARVRALELEQ